VEKRVTQKLKLRFPSLIAIGVLLLSGCSSSLPKDASSQLDYACTIINDWPVDYATVWPTAVRKHNESPDLVSASSYMEEYVDAASLAFGIDDPEALKLVESYKGSWNLLELDLIRGGGRLPADSSSSSVVGDLMQYCEDTGRGFNK